jgi:hypothetical protein
LLKYDIDGNLCVVATVVHEVAKRCGGFSIGARVRKFVIRNAARADCHAEVLSAELVEVSLVIAPLNARARVLSRQRPPV